MNKIERLEVYGDDVNSATPEYIDISCTEDLVREIKRLQGIAAGNNIYNVRVECPFDVLTLIPPDYEDEPDYKVNFPVLVVDVVDWWVEWYDGNMIQMFSEPMSIAETG